MVRKGLSNSNTDGVLLEAYVKSSQISLIEFSEELTAESR